MFIRRPIFPGNTDTDQLDKIWGVCGSPNQQNWPDYDKLPNCGGQTRFRPQERRVKAVYESYVGKSFHSGLSHPFHLLSLGKETCALLDKLLILDPRERITASEALDHEYFWSDPLPADPKRLVSSYLMGGKLLKSDPLSVCSLPRYEASHELDQRGRRMPQEIQKPIMNPPQPPFNSSNSFPPPPHQRTFNHRAPFPGPRPPIPMLMPQAIQPSMGTVHPVMQITMGPTHQQGPGFSSNPWINQNPHANFQHNGMGRHWQNGAGAGGGMPGLGSGPPPSRNGGIGGGGGGTQLPPGPPGLPRKPSNLPPRPGLQNGPPRRGLSQTNTAEQLNYG